MTSHRYINKFLTGQRDGLGDCATPTLRSGTIAVPATAILCLALLAVVLKTITPVPPDHFSSGMILYVIFYLGLIVSFPLCETRKITSSARTMIWTGAILLITLGIVAFSAL